MFLFVCTLFIYVYMCMFLLVVAYFGIISAYIYHVYFNVDTILYCIRWVGPLNSAV